ncbi:MAG: histidine kinase, partial [Bacillota bacterium]|nr:histidine kinase [Bacillota bacterium]
LPAKVPLEDALNEVEKNLVEKAYKEYGSSYAVAKALNTSQSKASRLIRKYCGNAEKDLSDSKTT